MSKSAGRDEQGRVQGAAGALESLGRTIGPVWGNGSLQRFGEGTAYGSAAVALLGAAALTFGYRADAQRRPDRGVSDAIVRPPVRPASAPRARVRAA